MKGSATQRLVVSFILFTVAMLGFNTVGSGRTLAQAVPLSLFQGLVFVTVIFVWERYRNRKK